MPRYRSAMRPSKLWTRLFLPLCIGANRFPGRPVSWPGRAFCDIDAGGARGPRLCPISTLVRMLLSGVWPCSPAMPPVITAIFRESRSSLPQSAGCDSADTLEYCAIGYEMESDDNNVVENVDTGSR